MAGKFIKKNKIFLLLFVFSLISLILKILFIFKYSIAFTFDQGRDFLDLREMAIFGKIRLIGPATSLQGIYFGPFWYWVIFPFYLILVGHPLAGVFPLLILGFLTPFFIYWFLEDKKLAFFLGVLFIFSYPAFEHSRVALNPHLLIFITPLIFIFFGKFLEKEIFLFLYLALFLAGVALHFQVVIALLWLPVFFISSFVLGKIGIFLKEKKSFIFYLFPLVPQIIFEVRHGFLQTKALINVLFYDKEILGFRFYEKMGTFFDVFRQIAGENFFLTFIFVLLFGFLVYQFMANLAAEKKDEAFCLLTVGLVFLFVSFFWLMVWPFTLKSWDLVDIEVLFLIFLGLSFYYLSRIEKKGLIISCFLLFLVSFFSVSPFRLLPFEKFNSPDPANLRTRLKVIDLIYNDAGGKGMRIFTFAPYVYDYPYQYLIWWRAKTKYRYLPEEYVYLPNQPKYVAAKEEADSLIPKKISECTYLIIEPFESQEKWFWQWRGNFGSAKKIWEIGRTRVEKLCQRE